MTQKRPRAMGEPARRSIHWRTVDSPIGSVFIAADERGVLSIRLDVPVERALEALPSDATLVEGGGFADEAATQIEDYFAGRRADLDLPVAAAARTPFDRDVIAAVSAIPPGETRAYSEVAAAVGRPRAARAVGNVMRGNRVLLAVPCHRVVAPHGLGGYGGRLDLKRWLLEHERRLAARSSA